MAVPPEQLRAYVDYLRDMGIYDLYRHGEPVIAEAPAVAPVAAPVVEPVRSAPAPPTASIFDAPRAVAPTPPAPVAPKPPVPPPVSAPRESFFSSEPPMPKLTNFTDLAPLPTAKIPAAERPSALKLIQDDIGECTRCPLAYAGRHKIVFGNGDPSARLMFVGEGPGADEDAQGFPFVGKAGQLLNNMIGAMGLTREQVYVANIVKCRPPNNRVPEPVEAMTCSQFLVRQIDVVQPEVIVALGATAALYLLGVKKSLVAWRGHWHSCRGAKLAVTYHPAFLLRDPRQKAEAWKDLQMVMAELGLQSPKRG